MAAEEIDGDVEEAAVTSLSHYRFDPDEVDPEDIKGEDKVDAFLATVVKVLNDPSLAERGRRNRDACLERAAKEMNFADSRRPSGIEGRLVDNTVLRRTSL